MKLSPRARQIASAVTLVAAVVLVGRVIRPRLRHDVTVRVSLAAWRDRGLAVRAVGVCVRVDAEAVCAAEHRVRGAVPSAITETLRLPEGEATAEVRVVTDTAVQEGSAQVLIDPNAALELSAPPPPP